MLWIKCKRIQYCVTLVLLFVFVSSNSFAQSFTVDESNTGSKDDEAFNIDVTAQKRTEKVQDVPASITALNAKDIEEAGIEQTQDITAYVPNMVTFNNFMDSFSFYSLRGQTSRNNYSTPIGVYVDDVPIISSMYSSDVQLWNIEQIEVLRGASGNLYGLNSTAGVINIRTRQPDNYWTAGAITGYGSYNSFHVDTNVSGPIVKDTLYFGASGTYRRSDDYIEEEGNDDRSKWYGGGRGQMRYTPFDRLDISLTVDASHYDANYNSFTLVDSDPYKIDSHNHEDFNKGLSSNESIKIKYEYNTFNITSVTALSQSEMDGSQEMFMSGDYYYDWGLDSDRFLQEIRLTSNKKE